MYTAYCNLVTTFHTYLGDGCWYVAYVEADIFFLPSIGWQESPWPLCVGVEGRGFEVITH